MAADKNDFAMKVREKMLARMRDTEGSGSTKEYKGSRGRKTSESSGDEKKESASAGSAVIGDIEVDIRLDSDLTDYEERSRRSRFDDSEIDIDLTNFVTLEPSLDEAQLLSIDPTKSFSSPADLNFKKLADGGFITPESTNSILSVTFRQLKRPLLDIVRGKSLSDVKNPNLIMFTSSVNGEGKTFSAVNMAMSIAMERDRRVLLVDADINSPSHHELFGVEMGSGLTDFLTGKEKDLSRVIRKTNIPALSLVLAGRRTAYAPELFASNVMESLVAELASRYEDRIVIFDSAPLLMMTEASVLASHMGQIVLVVEAEKTRQEMVQRSLEILSNDIVLLLLNKMREQSEFGAYGFYGRYDE